MSQSASSPRARQSLRRLSSPHALDFSARLLHRGSGGSLTFREFVDVAKEVVREQPDATAVFLAALVALDMGAPDEEDTPRRPSRPSAN